MTPETTATPSTTTTAPTTAATPSTNATPSATRPSVLRRAAVGTAGVLAGFMPTVWGVNVVVELVTGAERDHLFHQVTGQGLLLTALWLGSVAVLVRDGWRGRSASPTAGALLLAWCASGLVAGVLAPGAGGLLVASVAAVTAGLLWLALPRRPRLRREAGRGLHPVLAPVALAAAALLVPFALGEAALQQHSGDEHAAYAHYFDMAWLALTIVAGLAAAALGFASRRLAAVCGAALVWTGAAALLITDRTGFGAAALVVGLAALASRP